MATITEDYVSFEVAKLLKEKGFNEPTLAYAYGQDMIAYYSQPRVTDDYNVEAGRYPLPTLQMACKWLRIVHDLYIMPHRGSGGFLYLIERCSDGSVLESAYYGGDIDNRYWSTPEKAIGSAIKYCLEHLI